MYVTLNESNCHLHSSANICARQSNAIQLHVILLAEIYVHNIRREFFHVRQQCDRKHMISASKSLKLHYHRVLIL